MVTLLLDQNQLEVALAPLERLAARRSDNIRIARASIAKVQLTDDPWNWLRGVPHPGTHIPTVLAAGIWRATGGVDFVMVRRRRVGVVIDLEGAEQFQRLILSTRHGLTLTQALRLEVSTEPEDVTVIVATGSIPIQGASADVESP